MASSNRLEQVERIFFDALELPREERLAFVERSCGSDIELRDEVGSLLAHEHKGESIFARAVAGASEGLTEQPEGETLTHAGPWRLVRQLGVGGMGAVWLAVRDDEEFQREVAVKFLRHNLGGAWAMRRFRHERQILAGLQHPNIASFYDGGTTADGHPYIVMEYVEGPPVTAWCRDRNLPVEERIRLFQRICSAVGYAHRNLIVHRDLKPSNILVHQDGEPKLLDFGIAKLTDPAASDAGLTQTGVKLLTPEYASPEQVRGEAITTATDVYALGLVLYELLTGEQAQRVANASPLELDRAVCVTTPRPPSTAVGESKTGSVAARLLKGDLDNIVLKAIRKEPERRYASVNQLSEDLDHFLAGRPVSARSDTLLYRTTRFLQRNRVLSATAAAAALSLVVGTTVALYQAAEARRQAAEAERRFAQVRKLANTFLFDFHDRIQNLPGSTPAREMVASTALGYLDSLAKDAEGNPELQRELAQAYEKVGDVQGLPGSSNLGRSRDAKASYERALAIAEKLPENGVLKSELWLRLGMLEAVQGDSTKAVQLEQRAVAAAEEEFRRTPSSKARRAIIAAAGQAGSQLVMAQRLNEGVALLRRSLEAEQQESRGMDAPSLLRVALAHSKLAASLKMGSDRAQTLEHLSEAQRLAERSLELNPNNAAARNLLINVHRDRADTISSPFTPPDMDWAGALASYRAAQAIASDLVARDPSNQNAAYQVLLARASIADLLRETDPKAAAPAIDSVREDWKRYAPLHADNLVADRMLMNIHSVSGMIRTRLGRYEQAEAEFGGAEAIAEKLFARDPKRFTMHLDRLLIYSYRGVARASAGRDQAAEHDFALCRQHAASISDSVARARELREAARCYEHSGDLAQRRDREAAQAHYRAAREKWLAIVKRGNHSNYLDEQIELITNKLRRAGGAI